MKKCIKMYENNYKNKVNTNIGDLWNLIQLLADLDQEIELYAIGGTAMVIENIKESTKDIDFLTTAKYEKLKALFELAGLKEEKGSKLCNIWYLDDIRIDVFYDEFIMGISLPEDWRELSTLVRDTGKVKLHILNWYDIIITKIARSETRDIEDVLDIINKKEINMDKLKKRYYEVAEVSLIKDFDIKFKHLEKELKKKK